MCKKCTCEKDIVTEENPKKPELNFRKGGVGIKNIDYKKVVEIHYDFLSKLVGVKKKEPEEKK